MVKVKRKERGFEGMGFLASMGFGKYAPRRILGQVFCIAKGVSVSLGILSSHIWNLGLWYGPSQ